MRVPEIAAVIAFGLLLSVAAASIVTSMQDEFAKRDCFSAGGRVEHYDADRKQIWRCVGARAEAE